MAVFSGRRRMLNLYAVALIFDRLNVARGNFVPGKKETP
jgi:hypothetical protein